MIFWALLAVLIELFCCAWRATRGYVEGRQMLTVLGPSLLAGLICSAILSSSDVRRGHIASNAPDPHPAWSAPLYDALWPLEKFWLTMRNWRWDGPVGEGDLFVLMSALGAVMLVIWVLLARRSK